MVAKRWRKVSAPVIGAAALLVTPLLMDCGGMPGHPGWFAWRMPGGSE